MKIAIDIQTTLGQKSGFGFYVKNLIENLKKFDSKDPVKYDFALFGIGVNKNICIWVLDYFSNSQKQQKGGWYENKITLVNLWELGKNS